MGKIKKARWTEKDKKYLKDNYKIKFYPEIAEHLNKTWKAVECKALRMGFKVGHRAKGRCQQGENNGNWKGGISKDKYHYKKLQVKRYPLKILARQAVQKALKSGRLFKPNKCEECKKIFSKDSIQGHHEDYDKPLEVRWLCRKCHREEDKKL